MAVRSTHVTLENRGGTLNLRRTAMELDHGVFTDEPPLLIGNRGEWESESSGIATGTEGRVTYQIEDLDGGRVGEVRLHWDNPFIGSNSYDESVAPAAADATDTGFSVVHVGGAGDNANVRFVLLNGFCSVNSETGEIACSTINPLTGEGQRYAAIWEQTPGPSFHALHGLTSAEYQQRFDELVGQGFRLVQVSGYSIGDEDHYAAIFEQREGPPFAAHHRLTSAEYQQRFDELVGQGFRLVQVSGYLID